MGILQYLFPKLDPLLPRPLHYQPKSQTPRKVSSRLREAFYLRVIMECTMAISQHIAFMSSRSPPASTAGALASIVQHPTPVCLQYLPPLLDQMLPQGEAQTSGPSLVHAEPTRPSLFYLSLRSAHVGKKHEHTVNRKGINFLHTVLTAS